MNNFMRDLARFSVPLTQADATEWPPRQGEFNQLHFQKSEVPGHVQVFVDGRWYELPAILLMNSLCTICPLNPMDQPGKPPSPPAPPPVRRIGPT